MRERHLSIFAEEWIDWLGTRLAEHAPLVDPARCQGGIDQVTPVGAPEPTGWSAAGWAWDTKRGAVPSRIVIADVNGRIVGYGLAGFAKAGPRNGGGWRGHFAAAQSAPVAAYALLDNGSIACRLGR